MGNMDTFVNCSTLHNIPFTERRKKKFVYTSLFITISIALPDFVVRERNGVQRWTTSNSKQIACTNMNTSTLTQRRTQFLSMWVSRFDRNELLCAHKANKACRKALNGFACILYLYIRFCCPPLIFLKSMHPYNALISFYFFIFMHFFLD